MEQKTNEDKGFNTDIEVSINAIEEQVNAYDEIEKIIFGTSKGNITYKPKTESVEFRDGIKRKKLVKAKHEDLPEFVKKLGNLINSNGNAKVLVAYNYWKTEKDGEPITYRFILSAKTFEQWKILDDGSVVVSKENVI